MRIALVNKMFSQKGGGAERYAVDLTNALVAQGHQVDCYGNIIEDVAPEAGKYYIPMFSKPGYLRILSFAHNFKKTIKKNSDKYDIVYALTQAYPADLYFMGGGAHKHWLKIRFPNCLLNFIKRLVTPTHSAQIWLESQIFKAENCHVILANSHLIKEHARQYGEVSPDRVFVVHNGIDNTRFNSHVAAKYRKATRQELSLKDNEITIAYLSHNWSRKGLQTILEAIAKIKKENNLIYKVIIAGKGNILDFKEKGIKLGLTEDQMIFLGSCSTPEKIYGASDICVLPTMYDPCAGVTVEAMACALPIITTPDNGAHELVRHNESGFILSKHNNSAELAEYLLILKDPAIREKLGKQAEEDINYRTFDQVVKESIKAMEAVLQHKRELSNEAR